MKSLAVVFICLLKPVNILAARDQAGKEFLIFQAYNLGKDSKCALGIHAITDHYSGALVNMLTPRLSLEDGGFRRSAKIKRHELAVLCAPRRKMRIRTGRSDMAILVTSDQEISVIVETKTSGKERELHVAYPLDVLGTVYFVVAHPGSLLIIVAADTDTAVDVSNFIHTHRLLQHYKGSILLRSSARRGRMRDHQHYIRYLERYEAVVIRDIAGRKIKSGVLVMSSKPVVALTETFRPSPIKVGYKDVGFGHASDQLVPKETWDKEFYILQPANPQVVSTFLIITVEIGTHRAEIKITRPQSGTTFQGRKLITSPVNRIWIDMTSNEAGCIQVNVDVPATAVLSIQTTVWDRSGISVVKIPPASQFFSFYVVSIAVSNPWKTFLHVITQDVHQVAVKDAKGTTMTHSKLLKTYTVSYDAMEYSLGPGVYIITYKNSVQRFMVFLESFIPGEPNTVFTEVGMRFALTNQKCKVTDMIPDDTLDNDCNGMTDEDGSFLTDADKDSIPGEDVALQRVNGEPSEWGEWECGGDCATGVLVQRRLCDSPPPSRGGKSCSQSLVKSSQTPCTQSATLCLSDCVGDRWGLHCQNQCAQNCINKKCSRYRGECYGGCKRGFYGLRCKIPCHRGYGGRNCSVRCTDVCHSADCDPVTLRCGKEEFSLVTIGVAIVCIVIFTVCPAFGFALYALSMKLERYSSRPYLRFQDEFSEGSEFSDDDWSSSTSLSTATPVHPHEVKFEERIPEGHVVSGAPRTSILRIQTPKPGGFQRVATQQISSLKGENKKPRGFAKVVQQASALNEQSKGGKRKDIETLSVDDHSSKGDNRSDRLDGQGSSTKGDGSDKEAILAQAKSSDQLLISEMISPILSPSRSSAATEV